MKKQLYPYSALVYFCIDADSKWITIYGEHMGDAIDSFYKTHSGVEIVVVED